MSETTLPRSETEYQEKKAEAIEALIAWLKCAEQLGKPQGLIMGEFMQAFQKAAEAA